MCTYIKFNPAFNNNSNNTTTISNTTKIIINNDSNDYIDKIIKESFRNENYLISPYSIEIVLNMLKDGANEETKEEIESLIGNRNLNINNDSVKIANAIFIKKDYEDIIENTFINKINNKYNGNVFYSDYNTTDIINNWVNDNTDGMINNIINEIPEEFVLGIANAIAIDAKWTYSFLCNDTKQEIFINGDNTLMVEMMHNEYNEGSINYIENDNIEGIILPYEEKLEFIAIKPNESLDEFINNFRYEEINDLINNSRNDKKVNLSIPRFSYNYDYSSFKDDLTNLGIKKVFDEIESDLTNIISRENIEKKDILNIYVSKAIHKTNIDLNEIGTKASAVTYIQTENYNAVVPEDDIITIEFNKPFIYMIRDTDTKELLFFGSVYEPNEWTGTTCDTYE